MTLNFNENRLSPLLLTSLILSVPQEWVYRGVCRRPEQRSHGEAGSAVSQSGCGAARGSLRGRQKVWPGDRQAGAPCSLHPHPCLLLTCRSQNLLYLTIYLSTPLLKSVTELPAI